MVAAFPLAKVGLLLLKQLSKPLANLIKKEARKHPYVRRYVIIPTGKAFRWLESATMERLKGSKEQEPMSEEEIIELGSNAIGEIILFGLLSIILLAEISRQGDKKAELRKMKEDEMMNVVEIITELMIDVEKLKKSMREIQSDLKTAFDVIELEEKYHTVIEDDNFLDIMVRNKRKRGKSEMNPQNLDVYSPSF